METTNEQSKCSDFSVGFWHPFGPHADEKPEEVLARKAREVSENGWTLWSFKFFRQETLLLWSSLIDDDDASVVYAFCSDSKPQHSTRPKGNKATAEEYKSITDSDWKPIPDKMKVTFHPAGDGIATAFMVKQVVLLPPGQRQLPFLVERFSLKQKKWRSDLSGKHEGVLRLPTRNESLIRTGGKVVLPSTQAVLELVSPFVVAVR